MSVPVVVEVEVEVEVSSDCGIDVRTGFEG